MATHRVFLIWTHTLFREAIRLSSSHPDFVWVGDTSDYRAGIHEIIATCPDTVVIEDVGENHASDIMSILKACSPEIRVIVMNLSNNKLNLYQHQEQVVTKADDLISCILRENS